MRTADADLEADPVNILVATGGNFEPFSEEELRDRYPDDGTYVRRMTRSAHHLVEVGSILEQDRDAYVDEAQQGAVVEEHRRAERFRATQERRGFRGSGSGPSHGLDDG
jgi:hypothetical protein